ncbi:MAG TPA: hypothetical protein VK009_10825 [Chloroflexota bacterium]|nr:hypothetical protein [Chloroflexota bacterium]
MAVPTGVGVLLADRVGVEVAVGVGVWVALVRRGVLPCGVAVVAGGEAA